MPNTIESVKKLILTAVQNASGWETIFGPSDGPEPANQYCLVTLNRQEKQSHDVVTWTETEDKKIENQRSESQLTFEIQVRGRDSMTVADKITSYFDSEQRWIDLWPFVGYGGHDEVQNISTYHEGKILPIAVVNIYIHTTLPKQNYIEFMKNVDVSIDLSVGTEAETIGPITIPEGYDS